MGNEEISKAWKDDEYRESLDEEKRAQIPESPIGEVQLSEEELKQADGAGVQPQTTAACTIAVTTVISAASVSFCTSILSGGTCHVDSAGCC